MTMMICIKKYSDAGKGKSTPQQISTNLATLNENQLWARQTHNYSTPLLSLQRTLTVICSLYNKLLQSPRKNDFTLAMIKQAQTTPPYKSSNSQSNSPANCCKTQQIYEQKVFLSWRTTEVTLACLLDCGHGCGAQGLTWQHSAPGLSSSAPFYVSPAKQQRIFFLSLESKLFSQRGKQEAEGSDCGVSASCFHSHQVPSMQVPTKAPWKSGPR